jgi:hypothetical protein
MIVDLLCIMSGYLHMMMLFTSLTLLITLLIDCANCTTNDDTHHGEDMIYLDKINHTPTERICTVNDLFVVQHVWHGCLLL